MRYLCYAANIYILIVHKDPVIISLPALIFQGTVTPDIHTEQNRNYVSHCCSYLCMTQSKYLMQMAKKYERRKLILRKTLAKTIKQGHILFLSS